MNASAAIDLATYRREAQRRERPRPSWPDELLDESAGFLGLGRSLTFPFPQYRGDDPYRTVYFDEGEGPAVVFVHGLGANFTHFELIAREMVDRYRCLGLDLVGCGWSAKPHVQYTIDLLRDHLISFLTSRGVRQATLIGHSLGGAVCLATAIKRPDLVERLILIGAAGVAPLPLWMRAAAPAFLHRALLYPMLLGGASFILNNVFVARPEANHHVRWFRRSAMRDEPGFPNLWDFARVCETLCRDAAQRTYATQLPAIQVPVLAIWGDADRLTRLGAVLKGIGGARRIRTIVMKDCGHMPMVERPEETLFHIDRFFESPP